MRRAKKLLLLALLLLLIAAGVYAYVFTAESQSNQVKRIDPEKAERIRSLHDELGQPGPPKMNPPD